MGEEWKELDTGKKFWSEFNEAQNLGQSVRIEKAEGNPEYERNKKIFNNARKVVQKKLEEKKLVDYLVTSPIDALRYSQMICEPLDRKQQNIKDLEDDHVLYGLSNHTMMDLTDEKRIVSLDKFLRKVIKEDDEQGGVKQQSLREMADLEEIPVEDTLFDASRLIVEAIERVGQGRENPMIKPWLKQALTWAVGGLGFNAGDASNLLKEE